MSNRDVPTNRAMANELKRNRTQRDNCAAQVKGLRDWRQKAAASSSQPAK